MKIVVQRVKEANVKVDNEIVGKISEGLMLLIRRQNESFGERYFGRDSLHQSIYINI